MEWGLCTHPEEVVPACKAIPTDMDAAPARTFLSAPNYPRPYTGPSLSKVMGVPDYEAEIAHRAVQEAARMSRQNTHPFTDFFVRIGTGHPKDRGAIAFDYNLRVVSNAECFCQGEDRWYASANHFCLAFLEALKRDVRFKALMEVVDVEVTVTPTPPHGPYIHLGRHVAGFSNFYSLLALKIQASPGGFNVLFINLTGCRLSANNNEANEELRQKERQMLEETRVFRAHKERVSAKIVQAANKNQKNMR